MIRNHTTPAALFVLIAIAAVVAMLLAASTVAVASNHSAFAWKEKGYKKDRYQKDENKYQNDGSDSKYVMGSKRGSGNSITVIAANDQNNECKTSGNMSPIGAGACVNTGTATATPPPPPTTGTLLITKVCNPDCPGAGLSHKYGIRKRSTA
jgi:hypothetical protein